MPRVKIKNNIEFPIDGSQTIIEAAKQAGISLDHSCLRGMCSSCRFELISGETRVINDEIYKVDDETEKSFILGCCRTAVTDIEIDATDLSEYNLAEIKIFPVKIKKIEKISSDVIRLILRFPPNNSFKFTPGQYVDLIKGGIKRSYSIAGFNEFNELSFFIKKYDNGFFSNYLFNEAKIDDLLRIEGPKGTFFLRKNVSNKKILFVATGTGIAPIKSIIENTTIDPSNFSILWGVRKAVDVYWTPPKMSLFTPVFSRENKSEYVQDFLLRNFKKIEPDQVFCCGSESMINSVEKLLKKNNFDLDNFYADYFVKTN